MNSLMRATGRAHAKGGTPCNGGTGPAGPRVRPKKQVVFINQTLLSLQTRASPLTGVNRRWAWLAGLVGAWALLERGGGDNNMSEEAAIARGTNLLPAALPASLLAR